MTLTDIATQLSIFQSEEQPVSTVYDISTKAPIPDQSTPKNKKTILSIPILPVSPSGQFSPGKENLTSDGRNKATPGDALRSYDDYRLLSQYFLDPKKRVYGIRNYALLTIGIATGLRISDLVSLKLGHLLTIDKDGNIIFKDQIDINEKKTGKRTVNDDDEVFITEAIRIAVEMLLAAYAKSSIRSKKIKKVLNLDDWLFQSPQPRTKEYCEDENGILSKNPLYGEYVLDEGTANGIFKDAQRDLGLEIDLCTRTTRKTFTSLVVMVSRSRSNSSVAGIEMAQIMLRHGDVRKTMRYIGVAKNESREIRNEISNWLLGKSTINRIKI